jgi:hypothetical protein
VFSSFCSVFSRRLALEERVSKADEIRREQELAERARPVMIDALREGRDPLEIARMIASEFQIDERQAYRWAQYTAEAFDRRRRRVVALGVLLLWVGVLGIAAGILVTLFAPGADAGSNRVAAWVVGLVSGLPVAAAGSVIALRARRLVRKAI